MKETPDDRARRRALARIDRSALEAAAARGDRAAQRAIRKLVRKERRENRGKK